MEINHFNGNSPRIPVIATGRVKQVTSGYGANWESVQDGAEACKTVEAQLS